MSPLGIQRDEKQGDLGWDGEWFAAAIVEPSVWTVEMKIPFEMLDLPQVENSTSRAGNPDFQKVLFKFNNTNAIELEMRNESPRHYRQIRLNMIAKKCFELLRTHIPDGQRYRGKPMISYERAVSNFGKW